MQKDTILYDLPPSYVISEALGGGVGEFKPVDDVQIIVNGTTLGYYVDLGLIDSMKDVLVETAGAAIYTIIYVIARGKHFVFMPIEKAPALLLDTTPLSDEESDDEALEEAAIATTVDDSETDITDIEN